MSVVDDPCGQQDGGEDERRIEGCRGAEVGADPLPEEEQLEIGHAEHPQHARHDLQHEDAPTALGARLEIVVEQVDRGEDAECRLQGGQHRAVGDQAPVGQQAGDDGDRRVMTAG